MAELRDDFTYQYIGDDTTTQVYTGAGRLHRVIIGEDAAGTIKIIDGTSGSTSNFIEFEASMPVGSYEVNAKFATGLRVVPAAASKITVIYSKG